jgi:hypothetical protein
MTEKRQWLLFGAILGVGTAATWALVRWGGLLSPSPPTPSGSVAVSRAPDAPAPPQQVVLPFTSREIERALRWDGIIHPDMNARLVSAYLITHVPTSRKDGP